MLKISSEGLARLQEVKAYVMEEPRRFIMADVEKEDEIAPCGTACCIAGHLLLLDRRKRGALESAGEDPLGSWVINANHLLMDQAPLGVNSLFFTSDWPREYADRYNDIGDWPARDKEIAELIEDGTLSADNVVDGIAMGWGWATKEAVAKARIHNAQVMCELIDEVCAKGGLWWVNENGTRIR